MTLRQLTNEGEEGSGVALLGQHQGDPVLQAGRRAGAALHRHLQGHPPEEAVVTPAHRLHTALPCNML